MPKVSPTLSVMFAYSATGVFWGAFAAATPAIMNLSGLDAGGFGLLLVVMTAGAVPAMVFLSRLPMRLMRWVLLASLSLFAVAALALSQSTDLISLTVAFLLAGAASGASDVALNLRVSEIERSGVERLFNRAHAMFPLAYVVASPIAGLARESGVGLELIFLCVCAVLVSAGLIETAAATGPQPMASADGAEQAVGGFRSYGFLLMVGIVAALGAFQEMAVQTWSAIFMESVLFASASLSSLAPAAFTAGLSLGRFAAHLLEGVFEAVRLTLLMSAFGVFAFVIIAASSTTLLALVGFALAGIAVGPIEPTVYRTVTERTTERQRATALSAVTMIVYIGYLSSPPLLGAVAQMFDYQTLWLVCAGFALSIVVLLGVLRRTLVAKKP